MSSYTETQKFNSYPGYIILALVGVGNFILAKMGEVTDISTVFITVIPAILIFLLFEFAKLQITISQSGLEYSFFPLLRGKKNLLWNEINHIKLVTYKPLADYGGWGVRKGKKGRAFNTRGKYGLLLSMKEGSPILFGTQRPEELDSFLSEHAPIPYENLITN